MKRREFLTIGGGVAFSTLFSRTFAMASSSPDITHGPRHSPNIALTFHGAGDLEFAQSLLATFRSTSTPVTVFAIGTWLKENPTIAKKILDGGHEIGNHTLNHFQMKTLSAARVKSEIMGCAEILKQQIGNHGSYFRPSGTQFSTSLIRSVAQRTGYKQCISYDVDSLDYQDPGSNAVIKNVMTNVRNGSIVSLHFGHKNTVEAMPTLIEKLHQAGFNPVTVTQLLA